MENSVLCMAQDMQMLKEKMDMIMNAMRGWVSTSLDELVHRMDSPFIAQVTSIPLPMKFLMPQVEAYDRSRDPFYHLESFKPSCTYKEFLTKYCAGPSLPHSRGQ